jgi:hypothetical protein
MSSTDLNNEGYFSDHPKRLPSFDDLFRAQAQLTPERFFRNLEQQSGDFHCSQDDFQRAVFLFQRLQSARQTISRLILFLVAVSAVPFVCLALPEDWGSCLNCWRAPSFSSNIPDGKLGAETIVIG